MTHQYPYRRRTGIAIRYVVLAFVVFAVIVASLVALVVGQGALRSPSHSTSSSQAPTSSAAASTTTTTTVKTALSSIETFTSTPTGPLSPSTTQQRSSASSTSGSTSVSSGNSSSSPTKASNPLLSDFQVGSLRIYTIGNATVADGLVYIASNASQQAQGFMNVTSFGDCNGRANAQAGLSCIGMMFVFPSDENVCFWMHDTLIPLQQDWISSNGTVSYVYQAQAEDQTSVCHAGQLVLETFPNLSIVQGDQVSFSTLLSS